MATSLNNLGAVLRAQGDLEGARGYYERALAIREKALGADHPDVATSLNNLGALAYAQGDLEGARGYLERAQGDLEGARGYHERALAIWEKALGADHPDVATSLNNLGLVA